MTDWVLPVGRVLSCSAISRPRTRRSRTTWSQGRPSAAAASSATRSDCIAPMFRVPLFRQSTADKLQTGSSLLAAPREADIGHSVKDPPGGCCHFRGPEMAHPAGRSIFHPRRPSLEADAFAYSLTRSRQRAVILLAPLRSPVYTFLSPVRRDSTGHFFVCANTNSTSVAANQRHPRKCKSPANPLDSIAADSEATRLRFTTEHGGRDVGRQRTRTGHRS